MTDPRRTAGAESPRDEATRHPDLDALRATDAPLVDFVVAGGLRGLTPTQMFAERVA